MTEGIRQPMTQPAQPLVDTGNPFLSKVPVQLGTGEVTTSEGRFGVATFRTPGTTLTAMLTRDEALSWAAAFQSLADQLTGLTVIRDGGLPLLGVPGTGAGQ